MLTVTVYQILYGPPSRLCKTVNTISSSMVSKDDVSKHWVDPIPLDTYQELVVNTTPDKVKGCPANTVVGTPEIEISCGPNIRFLASNEDGKNNYRGTILLVTEGSTGLPTIDYVIGSATENDKLTTGNFPGYQIYEESGHTFWRFDIDLELAPYEQKIWYSVNGEYLPEYQFYIPSIDASMNVMSYSCNGFSLDADTSTFQGSLWLEVLRRHSEFHYHVMLGGGDQIYCDSIKNISKEFARWLKHKTAHSNWKLSSEIKASLDEYYLNHYIEWFGKGYMAITKNETVQAIYPKALHGIPQINIFDDHDIIDGFGSYDRLTMSQQIFMGVGRAAFKYYLLFQHHIPPGESVTKERSYIGGVNPGPYIDQCSRSNYARLGKEIAFLGLDCRTERSKHCIMTESSYKVVFDRLEREIAAAPEVKHLLVLLGVPIMYPRMVWAEVIMESRLLGPIKWLAKKKIILSGLVNEFDGSIELLDDLNDHWCAMNHKLERNQFMKRLTEFGASHGVRITILSGDVHLCCMSRFQTKVTKKQPALPPQKDPRLIVSLISSAIVNTPPPDGMARMLQNRSKIHHYDRHTEEDMIPLFMEDTDGKPRSNHLFMNKRNFSDLILGKNLSDQDLKPYRKFKKGQCIYPGPATHLVADNGKDRTAYPLGPESLVAMLHVEVSRTAVDSKSKCYQVVIPTLDEKVELTNVGKKL